MARLCLASPRGFVAFACALALALTLLLAAAPQPAAASVIGIDFGTDWSKTALVRSGAPLDIVLNTESKRKTPSVVLVKQGDRRYGSDAVALSTRFPQDNYPALKNLLGKLYDDPIAAAYRDTFANRMVRDPIRGTVSFTFNETTTFSVEELVAMQLAAAKKQAEDAGQEFVAGAVLTVPPYWGQFERRALLDAAELANLRVLALVSDETAVALNYASGRTFGVRPEHHIFYDMGAGSTVAALVRFQQASPPAGKKASSSASSNVVELEVQAVGYDASLGGHSVDVKLQQHLAQEFTKKHGLKLSKHTDVSSDSRAMAKLLREATRVKQILSANTETFASVEGLIQDLDFRTKVTRAELESMSTDLAARVAAPVQQVLKQANITLDDLDSLILVGGGARVPFVQAALADLVGERRIAKNVNADEAAVMGAAFRGAGLSAQFRVRQIKVKDVNMHPVEVAYDAEPKESVATRNFHTTFFSDKTVLGAKKLMTFKRQSDFEFSLAYKGEDTKIPIVRAKISGLAAAIESKKGTALDSPKVKALIELTESGVISISEPAAYFEVEQVDKEAPSLKDTVMNFFKGKKPDDKAGGNADGDVEEVKDELTAENVTLASAGTSAAAGNATAAPTKKIVTETVKLDLTLDWQTVKPYDAEMVAEARIRLAALDASDAQRRKREEALNSLESFYYSGKQLLHSDEIEITSTEHERTTLQNAFDHVSEWLYDAADAAPLEELVAKLKELKDAHAPAWFRNEEYRKRDGAVESFKGVMKGARSRLVTWKEEAERAVAEAAAAVGGSDEKDADGEQTNDTNATTPAAADGEDNVEGESNATTTATPPAKHKPKSFHHIPADLEALETLLTRTETWFQEKLAAQTKLAPHDTPALLTADLAAKAKSIEKELERLTSVAAKAAKKAAAAAAAAAKKQKDDVKKAGRNVEEETRKMAEGLKEKLRKATEDMKKEAAAAKDKVKGSEKEHEDAQETASTATAGDGVHEEL